MPRKAFKYTPEKLLKSLQLSRFAFLSEEARQKIDELMELVLVNQAAREHHNNAAIRWVVLPENEKAAASHRMTVCLAVYCRLTEDIGLSQQQAISELLARGEMSRRASGLRTDQHQALRALGLRPGFLGMRTVQVWLEKIDGVPEGPEQLVALVPAHVLTATNSDYLDALAKSEAIRIEFDPTEHEKEQEQNHA